MVASTAFDNFTLVPNGTWEFAPGLNIIIGENGTGKTHVIKALYALMEPLSGPKPALTKAELDTRLADKLVGVFRPERLGRLVRRQRGRAAARVDLRFVGPAGQLAVEFGSAAEKSVKTIRAPQAALVASPVFFPTRELATLVGWFGSLYDNYAVEFDETYRDTVSLLGGPALRGPRATQIASIVEPLEELMGGEGHRRHRYGALFAQNVRRHL